MDVDFVVGQCEGGIGVADTVEGARFASNRTFEHFEIVQVERHLFFKVNGSYQLLIFALMPKDVVRVLA